MASLGIILLGVGIVILMAILLLARYEAQKIKNGEYKK